MRRKQINPQICAYLAKQTRYPRSHSFFVGKNARIVNVGHKPEKPFSKSSMKIRCSCVTKPIISNGKAPQTRGKIALESVLGGTVL